MQLKYIIDNALLEHAKAVKISTIYKLQKTKKQISSSLLEKQIQNISLQDLNDFFNEFYLNSYSFNYLNSFYSLFSICYKYAIEQNIITENIFLKIKKFKKSNLVEQELNFLTLEQFQLFIKYFKNDTYRLFFELLYWTGCRKGEALALSWNDIKVNSNTYQIYFNKTCSYDLLDKNKLYLITTPKTKNSKRIISIPKFLYDKLMQYKSQFLNSKKTDFIFGQNRPLATTSLQRHFKNALHESQKKHNIPDIRIHDLRHSHVSLLVNQKTYIYDVAKRIGDTVETVLNVYTHWFPLADKYIVEKLEDLYSNNEQF